MNQHLTHIAQKIGMDKAIAYSSGSRIAAGLTGVLSVFFITTFLTGVEQGFYYTFGSLLAMQVFFELGLTGIMTQFVAHEVSFLTLNKNNEYEGDDRYKSRLASLIHFCVKWYTVLAVIVFVFLMIVGFAYFARFGSEHEDVDWQIPWTLICLGTAIKLFQSPFTSIFMGLGKVKEMSKIGFWQQIILPAITWVGLAFGFKLYVVGIGYIASVVLWQIFVINVGLYKLLFNLWNVKILEKVVYFKEIFPFQWRMALSSLSGYFIFQLFNPVLFATEGPVIAGQMGMTWQALFAISSISYSWQGTKIPIYCNLIAHKEFLQLDKLFTKTVVQMFLICLLLLSAFVGVVYFLNMMEFKVNNNLLAERFLDYVPMALIIFPLLLSQFTNSWATYLRCHKQEPFLTYSIVSGMVSGLAIFYWGAKYGLYGVCISYCVIAIVFFPWGYRIFKTKKAEWHK